MRIASVTCLLYACDERARRDAATGRIAWREFVPVRRLRRLVLRGALMILWFFGLVFLRQHHQCAEIRT